jgi:serine/threonine-protein kinase RsbT
MNDLHAALVDLLTRHVSPIIARSILTRALREHRVDGTRLTREDLQALAPRLEAGVRLFVEPDNLPSFQAALLELVGERPQREALTLRVSSEHDLADALTETRRLCQAWSVRPIARQRVATVVSELARNIVSYTPGGIIEMIPLDEPTPRVLIRATDSGTGISNLDEVLAGKYKSRTGLGKGLLGSKRLADRFEVRTGRGGTVVEAELEL